MQSGFDMEGIHEKLDALKTLLKGYGRVAVAFSGGVDSTFLLKVAHDVLGDDCIALTVSSDVFPKREHSEAVAFCRAEGIKQAMVEVDVLSVEGFADNPPNRCYLCKRALFGQIIKAAETEGASVVCEGSNLDDLDDYRPGLQAISELGIASPLRVCGLSKAEIRKLSDELGLPTFNKPSFACLASRFPYGQKITSAGLLMVEQAEDFLRDAGFRQVRVRIHRDVARIEVEPDSLAAALEMRESIASTLKSIGFTYVALDLLGYRTGSLNERLYES